MSVLQGSFGRPDAPGAPDARRRHAVAALRRYCGETLREELLAMVPAATAVPTGVPHFVELPDWAADLGAGTPASIPVDAGCLLAGDGPAHERCDWWSAAFLHLEGWLERSVERRSGPIQSYSHRLPAEWSRLYDHAWANRVGLFMRRAAARRHGCAETDLFGPLPEASIILTHDVDAWMKTPQLRIKTAVMAAIATARHMASGRPAQAWRRLAAGVRFVASKASYDLFADLCEREAERGCRSIFFFADSANSTGFKAWLIDPSYRADTNPVRERIAELASLGWGIGMHPGFNTWRDPRALAATRLAVSEAAGHPVRLSRQHWLRFSWAETWKALSAAGVTLDFTLGFNDRPGFRNGAALRYSPWDHDIGTVMPIETIPTLFMDSHFYDYAFPPDPVAAMTPWIDELLAVRGEASVIWHTQTMHPEYGWAGGYLALLDTLVARGVRTALA